MSIVIPFPSHRHRRPSVKEIRDVFPSAYAAGIILPELGRGLQIEFNKRANLFDELGLKVGSSSALFSKKLFRLAQEFGFLNLNNCEVPAHIKSSNLSQGANAHGNFVQDPFHCDFNPLHSEYVTVMVRSQANIGRAEPTYYALEADVRQAISRIPRAGLSAKVIWALTQMERPDYRFRLFDDDERNARDIIQKLFPAFTQIVFDLIPEGRKYTINWKEGVADIAVHSNKPGMFLHARPTGWADLSEYPKNPIRGLEIYHG